MRVTAFGQLRRGTFLDRFGVWLSVRQVRRYGGEPAGKVILDAGCGYYARLGVDLAKRGGRVTCVDVAIAPELHVQEGLAVLEGTLPEALGSLGSDTFDHLFAISILEHLWEPGAALAEFHRLLKPGGLLLVNVPSWRGKWFLEYAAFRLGLSPEEEMDDHKAYYDPRDLWPLLVRAGFRPSAIQCFRHKFGLNTFAVCRKGAT